jgi:hypothetical protein
MARKIVVTRSGTLATDMNAHAARTWRLLVAGDSRGIRLREDTITETNLLSLDLNHPYLHVHRFNQSEEKASGGDWQWYIGSDRAGWFGLRIQAKRMDDRSYKMLDHPGELEDEYQFDTLIRSADDDRRRTGLKTFPYYVFFNGWSDGWPSGAPWNICPNRVGAGNCSHADVLDFGCAASPARAVRAIYLALGRHRKRVEPHLALSMPWSWLFGQPGPRPAPPPPGRLPFGTKRALGWHQALERVAPDHTTILEQVKWPQESDASEYWASVYAAVSSPDESELSEQLPWHVRQILESRRQSEERQVAFEMEDWDSGVSQIIVSDLSEVDG